jgi:hypothetical protein
MGFGLLCQLREAVGAVISADEDGWRCGVVAADSG